jgi:hypothetical protein
MSVHDLVLSKLAAGRPHDYEFVEEAVRHGIVDRDQLWLGVELIDASHRALTGDRLNALMARVGS